MLLLDLRDTRLQPPVPPSGGRERTRSLAAPAICILSFWWFIKLSRDERPVGRGLAFAPGDIATGIRAITVRRSLLPTSQTRTPVGPPRGEPTRRRHAGGRCTGFPRSAYEACVRLGACCRPVRISSTRRHRSGRALSHITFWLEPHFPLKCQRDNHFGSLGMTILSQIHMCSPYSLPSRHPDCGFQEGASLALFSPPAEAGFRTLSRPLFIQAGRLTRWNGWSPSLHPPFSRGRQLQLRLRVAGTTCRSGAGRAAERSEAARPAGSSGGFGGPHTGQLAARNCSTVRPMSRAIFRRRLGAMSRAP